MRPIDGDSDLSGYFTSMEAYPVLNAEDERAALEAYAAAEIKLWALLLEPGDTQLQVLEALEDDVRPALSDLRSAVGRQREGARIRSVDFDRKQLAAALAVAGQVSAVRGAERIMRRKRDALVAANLRLVVSVARGYQIGRLPMADLIQEGNVGLIKAVDRFDLSRDVRFATYALHWIRFTISRALANTGRVVRLPVHVIQDRGRMARAQRALTTELSRLPTDDELAASLGCTVERLQQLRTWEWTAASLDEPVRGLDDQQPHGSLIDLLVADDDDQAPLAGMEHAEIVERLRPLLDEVLQPIEAAIIRTRFGLDGSTATLTQIAPRFSLSRERVRQLQVQALAKLRKALERR